MLAVETILRDRYKIIIFLARGSFGETYLAEDMDYPGKPKCVVKRLKPQSTEPFVLQEAKRLFDEEAETLSKLGNNHDQIPRLLAHFEENQEFYLVMEFIDGNVLSEELTPGTQWSEEQARLFLQDLLGVLKDVHKQQVIHRDIKPQNLIRRKKDDKFVLIDFGAVKEINTLINAQGQTSRTVAVGTSGYMPSEQSNGHPYFYSDVYAVGMVVIQALTGVPPVELPTDTNTLEVIWRDRAQVSPELAEILDKMVRYHFSQRYPSAAEALQALAQLTSTPTTTLSEPTSQSLQPAPHTNNNSQTNQPNQPWRSYKIGLSLLGVVGLGAVVAFIMWWQSSQPMSEIPAITYEDPNFGIKIKYPQSWARQEISNLITKEVVAFISPGESDSDRFQEKIIISVEDLSSPLSLSEYTDKSKQEIMQQTSNYKILNEGDYTLAGKAAHRVVYSSQDGDNKLKTMEVWMLKNYQAYSITYVAETDKYDKFFNTAEKMIKSLQVESKK
jgi:serine/threonine-protein kinase